MSTVTQGEHDTVIVLRTSGEEVRRFKGRRTLSAALKEFAEEKGIREPKITSGKWGTFVAIKEDEETVHYRATYARAN